MGADITPDDPVDIETLAADIQVQFRGRSVSVDEVIRYGLFRPHVLESHVRKAITALKKRQQACADGGHYHDVVSFSR
jgi:hypothetical protein